MKCKAPYALPKSDEVRSTLRAAVRSTLRSADATGKLLQTVRSTMRFANPTNRVRSTSRFANTTRIPVRGARRPADSSYRAACDRCETPRAPPILTTILLAQRAKHRALRQFNLPINEVVQRAKHLAPRQYYRSGFSCETPLASPIQLASSSTPSCRAPCAPPTRLYSQRPRAKHLVR